MNIQSRRVPLTVPHDLDVTLDRLCELQGRKKTQVITELLFEMKPALDQLADALEALQQKKDPMRYLHAMAADVLAKAGDVGRGMRDMQNHLDDNLELPL